MMSIRSALSVLSVLALLGLLGFLSACAPEPVPSSSASGGAAATTTAVRGISDVPMPSGADQVVDDSLVLGSLDRWTGRLVLETGLSPVSAFAFYRDRMPNYGWEPLASIQTDVSVLSFSRGERIATIQIESRSLLFGGSRVAITMAPRQGETYSGQRAGDSIEVTPFE
ncbi:MAG: hypothetical protein AB7P52_03070 [Alphaproteobacteria bacterium]